MIMTHAQALNQATTRLKDTCKRPRFEAEVLLSHYLGIDRAQLILRHDEVLNKSASKHYMDDTKLNKKLLKKLRDKNCICSWKVDEKTMRLKVKRRRV
jgi:hypothetical protein